MTTIKGNAMHKRILCTQKKCSKTFKAKEKAWKKFDAQQNRACTQKNDFKFYKCTEKFYESLEGVAYRKIYDKYLKCSRKKNICVKERAAEAKEAEEDFNKFISNLQKAKNTKN